MLTGVRMVNAVVVRWVIKILSNPFMQASLGPWEAIDCVNHRCAPSCFSVCVCVCGDLCGIANPDDAGMLTQPKFNLHDRSSCRLKTTGQLGWR